MIAQTAHSLIAQTETRICYKYGAECENYDSIRITPYASRQRSTQAPGFPRRCTPGLPRRNDETMITQTAHSRIT